MYILQLLRAKNSKLTMNTEFQLQYAQIETIHILFAIIQLHRCSHTKGEKKWPNLVDGLKTRGGDGREIDRNCTCI